MAASTTYDVRVNLSLTDRLTPGVRRQTGALQQLQRSARGATSTIDQLAKAAVLGFGIKVAHGFLVKYNAEVDDLKRKLSTIIMLNTGGDWTRAFGMASELTVKLREDAKLSAGTMQDMVGFAAAIANPVLAAGGNMEQLRDFTRQAVVAAAALGERADLAQLDITQALQGTLTQRDRFARALLSPMGLTTSAFNAKSASDRFTTLLKALNDPAIKAAAKSYETSFSGVTSTLKDNLQQIGGQIGQPLFQAITKQVMELNTWLTRNKQAVDGFVERAGRFLADGFGAARRGVELLVEHKDLLFALAKAYLVGKGVSLLVGPLAGLASLAGAAGSAGGALASLPGIISGVAMAATAFAELVDLEHETKIKNQGVAVPFLDQARSFGRDTHTQADFDRAQQMGYGATDAGVKMMEASAFIRRAHELGVMDPSGRANMGRINELAMQQGGDAFTAVRAARDMREAVAEAQLYAVRVAEMERRRIFMNTVRATGLTLEQYNQNFLRAVKEVGFQLSDVIFGTHLGNSPMSKIRSPKPPQVNVGRLVIEVQSQDPDRFVMGVEGFFQDWVRNPSQTPSFREGR